MNDIIQQLATFAPALVAQIKGNPVALEEFTRGYQETLAQQNEQRRRDDAVRIAEEDRTYARTRQDSQDRIAADDRTRRQTVQGQEDALRGLAIPGELAQLGATGETPDDAKALIESVMPRILEGFGQNAMAYGQPAVEMATRTITGRQKKAVEAYVDAALKTSFVAENPDADPELAQLPEHVAKIIGKPSAKLSELQQFAQLPVGKPQGKTRTPAAAGSFEDYVAKKYGEAPTPEQIIEARKVYNQADDRAPKVTINTGDDKLPKQEWVIRDGAPTPIQVGTARPGDVPVTASTVVKTPAMMNAESQKKTSAMKQANDLMAELKAVKDHPGKAAYVGTYTGEMQANYRPGSAVAGFKQKFERLKSLLAVPQLQSMKGLGAMSDREFATIQAGATSLSRMQPGPEFDAELDRLTESAQRYVDALTAAAPASTPPASGGAAADPLGIRPKG